MLRNRKPWNLPTQGNKRPSVGPETRVRPETRRQTLTKRILKKLTPEILVDDEVMKFHL